MTNIRKIHCNYCGVDTNHELKASHSKHDYEEEHINGQSYLRYYEESEFNFWVCRGCDTACIEDSYTCSGMTDENGDKIYGSTFYPERAWNQRKPKNFLHIKPEINSVYKEVVKAFQVGLGVPTAMSIRSLLEAICIDQGITDEVAWKFEVKIEKLQEVAGIPSSITDGLKSLKFIGDDAAHRLVSPGKTILSSALDLIEALLTHLYEAKFDLHVKAENIKAISSS
ncbi:DUF4145 domain-containing protein [Vibrio vulnificus]|nr:DUF4145 domain-containing protein [Vibrio vulnificus]